VKLQEIEWMCYQSRSRSWPLPPKISFYARHCVYIGQKDQLSGHHPPCTPPLFAKNVVKYTKKDGHFWPFFDLFLTSNRGPILLSKKPIPKTHVQLTPCHNLSPLRPSRPILLSANPQPRPSLPRQCRCHQHQPSLPTTVANDRCNNSCHRPPRRQRPLPHTITRASSERSRKGLEGGPGKAGCACRLAASSG
jgi:hypothetical protein